MKLSTFTEAVARLAASRPEDNKLAITLIDDNRRVVAHRVFALEECLAIEHELSQILIERIRRTDPPEARVTMVDPDGTPFAPPVPPDLELLAGFVVSLYRMSERFVSLADLQNWLSARQDFRRVAETHAAATPPEGTKCPPPE